MAPRSGGGHERLRHGEDRVESRHVKAEQGNPMGSAHLDRPLMTRTIKVVGTGTVRAATPDEHRPVPLEHQRENHVQQFREPFDELVGVGHVVEHEWLQSLVVLVAHHDADGTRSSILLTENEIHDVTREAAIGERQVSRVLWEFFERHTCHRVGEPTRAPAGCPQIAAQ